MLKVLNSVAAPNFEALFHALPSPYMVLDRGLCFVDANEAYCRITERSREELIGRHIFEMFPNEGESGQRLRESFMRVLETGQADSIPFIAYPIALPLTKGGGFELRYWSAVHTPLLDNLGRTAFIVQNTVDVTELQQLRQMAYGPAREAVSAGESDLLQRTQEVERANRLLRQETQELRDLFMQAPSFVAVLSGEDQVFTFVNGAYQQLIGHRPVIGKPLAEALPEVVEQGFPELLRKVMSRGEPYIAEAAPVMLRRTPDGDLEERFLDFIYQPMRDESGRARGVFVEGSDVTQRVRAEQQQKLLLDELNHRVKNSLATVQSIAAQTKRASADLETFNKAFQSRLMALSATHNLLTAANWGNASLRDVLAVEAQPHGPERYRLEGPNVILSPSETLTLGLVFHELTTNAAKYGALSSAGGRVEVTWSVDRSGAAPVLDLDWVEMGGPKVEPPARQGFGSRLIERSFRGEIPGAAALSFLSDGLRCKVRLPLAVATA